MISKRTRRCGCRWDKPLKRIILEKIPSRDTVTQDVVAFAKQCHVLPGDEVTPIVRRYIRWRNCGFSHEDAIGMMKTENDKLH